jgi:hypothetical protein
MVMRGAVKVGVMVGYFVIVGVKVGVDVCSRVGDGVSVTGMFITRVTSDVSTRVTTLVIATVWTMGTSTGDAAEGAQETQMKVTKHATKQEIKYFKRYTPS